MDLFNLDVTDIQVVEGTKGKIRLKDHEGDDLDIMFGSKAEPLSCEGLMQEYKSDAPAKPRNPRAGPPRRTMVISNFDGDAGDAWIKIEEHIKSLLPGWATTKFNSPFRANDAQLRVKVSDETNITLFYMGSGKKRKLEDQGAGEVLDIRPGCKVAFKGNVTFYNFKNDKDEIMNGLSIFVTDLMLDVTDATDGEVEAAPTRPERKKVAW